MKDDCKLETQLDHSQLQIFAVVLYRQKTVGFSGPNFRSNGLHQRCPTLSSFATCSEYFLEKWYFIRKFQLQFLNQISHNCDKRNILVEQRCGLILPTFYESIFANILAPKKFKPKI
jgi:hypothetical protein